MESNKDKQLPVSYLRECFDYNPESGELIWKIRPTSHFRGYESTDGGFNTKYSGKVAGSVMARGYIWLTLDGESHFSHRIAWAIYHGAYPDGQIDHINGIRTDNRIANLIEVSARDNSRNRKKPKTNTSGHIGVCKRGNSFRAYINGESGREWLGTFPSIDEAVKARKNAEILYGYHVNHGR